MLPFEYACEALENGLAVEAELATNPFKIGVVGGTDSHDGISTTDETGYFGKFANGEPSAELWDGNAFDFDGRTIKEWRLGASSLTSVWGAENTRASIWDAM